MVAGLCTSFQCILILAEFRPAVTSLQTTVEVISAAKAADSSHEVISVAMLDSTIMI